MNDNETIADIIAAMRDEAARADMEQGYSLDDAAEMMREFASRIEAAWKRERGDAAKLREALESCLDTICRIVWIDDPVYDEDGHYLGANYAAVSRDKARAALAEPRRNCDVGTAEEQAKRFFVFCDSNKCLSCPCRFTRKTDCALIWAQMPYEEGGTK